VTVGFVDHLHRSAHPPRQREQRHSGGPINTSKEIAYNMPLGLVFSGGCYVQVVSGTVVGSVDLL
jgi:hypothetical protein